MADLFADVKVGDVFFTHERYDRIRRHVVSRVTGSRFYSLTSNLVDQQLECSYAKKDGAEVGQFLSRGDSRIYAILATDDMIDKYRKDQERIRAVNLLRKAANILNAADGDEAIRMADLLPPELKG